MTTFSNSALALARQGDNRQVVQVNDSYNDGGLPERHVYKALRTGASSADANVDGSTTPVVFSYTAASRFFYPHHMIVFIRDTGNFDAEKYGNGVTLTNGIEVDITDASGTVVVDLLDGDPVKSNGEWQQHCFDYNYNDIGVGDADLAVRWVFDDGLAPLVLPLGYSLNFRVQDDLTGLVAHRVTLEGVNGP